MDTKPIIKGDFVRIKPIVLLLMILTFNVSAEQITGYIQVGLTIVNSPCVVQLTSEKPDVNCGTTMVKQTVVPLDSKRKEDGYLVTIEY